jgi:hypothetical protein
VSKRNSRVFRRMVVSRFTHPSCQDVRADANQALRTWLDMYAGILAPSQAYTPRNAIRRTGGTVMAMHAAAIPAEMSTTFVIVRALALVMAT